MSDLIDRQAAIDAVKEYFLFSPLEGRECAKAIGRVPSAQPVLTCDGCKHIGTYDTNFPCNGCVRREKDYYDPE